MVGGENGHLYVSRSDDFIGVCALNGFQPGAPMGNGALGGRPVPTLDELTLYFVISTPLDTTNHSMETWVAVRKSVADSFNDSVSVKELNTHVYTYPGWISPDGCRLYLDAGDVTYRRVLYMAERQL